MSGVRNIVAGVLSGLGVVILLQQYAVLYPTGTVTLIGVALGIGLQFAVGPFVGHTRRTFAVVASPGPTTVAEFPISGGVDWTDWSPTHRVPPKGLDAWPTPDASMSSEVRLDGGLDVRVDQIDGGWAQIVCENGWTAWVDLHELVDRA